MLKKLSLRLFLVIALLMVLSSTNAFAWDVDAGNFTFGAGEHYRYEYEHFSSRFGSAYTQEDFIITYSTTNELVEVSDDGTLYYDPSNWTDYVRGTLVIKYKPKTGNKSAKTFAYSYYIYNQFDGFIGDFNDVELGVGNSTYFDVQIPAGANRSVKLMPYDESVAEATFSQMYYPYRLNIKGIAVGETDVVLEASNGVQLVIHVTVVPAPTKITFAQEHFTLYFGDSIDIGTTLDGGHYGQLNVKMNVKSLSNSSIGTIEDDNTTFTPYGAGFYTVTLSAYNGACGTFTANVYNHSDSVRLTTSRYALNYDSALQMDTYADLTAYDAQGNRIVVPVTVTEGADVVAIDGYRVTGLKEGTAVITAVTDSGATDSVTLRVTKTPKKLTLKKTDVTIEVGESYTLEPVFDQGWHDMTYGVLNEKSLSNSGQHVIRVDESGCITALCPGTAEISVRTGYYGGTSLYASCYVTVPDSSKRLEIIRPTELLGVEETFQLSVTDQEGNRVPAVFALQYSSDSRILTVTSEGLITGVGKGTASVTAKLEDGQVLMYDQSVVNKPKIMTGSDLSFALDQAYCPLGNLESNIGELSWKDVKVEVLDTRIVTYASGKFTPWRLGSTQVYITSVYGSAQLVINVTVTEPVNTIYPDVTMIHIPINGSVKLPTVRDYYGNPVNVNYAITDAYNGKNPNGNTFTIRNGYVKCSWPSGDCKIICTDKQGRTCKIEVIAYDPPEKMYFREGDITIRIGETQQVQLWTSDGSSQGSVGGYYAEWIVGSKDIIRFEETHPGVNGPTVTGLKAGTTTLKAVLVNGVSAVCTITVLEEETPVIIPTGLEVYTENNIRYMKANSKLQFYCNVFSTGTTHLASTEVVWSVSDSQAGSIDANGLFTSARPRYDMDVIVTATSIHDSSITNSYTLMIDGELEGVPGDVNGDGTVDGRDVVRLLRYQAGESIAIVRENSDVNGDGVIDGRDALRLLKNTL